MRGITIAILLTIAVALLATLIIVLEAAPRPSVKAVASTHALLVAELG